MKQKLTWLFFFIVFGYFISPAQMKTTVLIQSSDADERVDVSIDKSIYFPGDTVIVAVNRRDSVTSAFISPSLLIEGSTLKYIGKSKYMSVLAQNVTPGIYPVRLSVKDSEGRRYRYDSDCAVTVEEYQDVEKLNHFIVLSPTPGSTDIRNAKTLDRDEVKNISVQFNRDSIKTRMGPQFVRITTSVLLRDGISASSYERRVMTFRSHGDPKKDRAMFIQYRTAYGQYANIRPEELERVMVPVDSLPDWAILGIHIEPDYSIKIGAVDRSNTLTQYYRVRGPAIEVGFSLAVPKVLYDTRPNDPVDYGNSSAMIRFYFINKVTGNQFPVSAGIGVFGVNSPIDVGEGRGGFALSSFLDMAEMIRILNIGFTKKINFGLEIDPFFPVKRKLRLLLVAQAGFSF